MEFQRGDAVSIIEDRRASGYKRRAVFKEGEVVQVLPRFVAVHNGFYVECVWRDLDEKNRATIRHKRGKEGRR